jgi:hypothetical protein
MSSCNQQVSKPVIETMEATLVKMELGVVFRQLGGKNIAEAQFGDLKHFIQNEIRAVQKFEVVKPTEDLLEQYSLSRSGSDSSSYSSWFGSRLLYFSSFKKLHTELQVT